MSSNSGGSASANSSVIYGAAGGGGAFLLILVLAAVVYVYGWKTLVNKISNCFVGSGETKSSKVVPTAAVITSAQSVSEKYNDTSFDKPNQDPTTPITPAPYYVPIQNFAQPDRTQVFLTHNWGVENVNHIRVSRVNKYLQSRGVKTWFDDERMTGEFVVCFRCSML